MNMNNIQMLTLSLCGIMCAMLGGGIGVFIGYCLFYKKQEDYAYPKLPKTFIEVDYYGKIPL